MPRSRAAYAPEFRQKMVELVHAGRSPEECERKALVFHCHADLATERTQCRVAKGKTHLRNLLLVKLNALAPVRTG